MISFSDFDWSDYGSGCQIRFTKFLSNALRISTYQYKAPLHPSFKTSHLCTDHLSRVQGHHDPNPFFLSRHQVLNTHYDNTVNVYKTATATVSAVFNRKSCILLTESTQTISNPFPSSRDTTVGLPSARWKIVGVTRWMAHEKCVLPL